MPKKNIYIYLHCACIGNWKEVLGKIKKNINSSGLYEKATEIRCSSLQRKSVFKIQLAQTDRTPEFV